MVARLAVGAVLPLCYTNIPIDGLFPSGEKSGCVAHPWYIVVWPRMAWGTYALDIQCVITSGGTTIIGRLLFSTPCGRNKKAVAFALARVHTVVFWTTMSTRT